MRVTQPLRWRTSSFTPGDHCVELADAGDGVLLRNSLRPDAGTLDLPHGAFASWLVGVRDGELDDLT